jgi:hypothetical protein
VSQPGLDELERHVGNWSTTVLTTVAYCCQADMLGKSRYCLPQAYGRTLSMVTPALHKNRLSLRQEWPMHTTSYVDSLKVTTPKSGTKVRIAREHVVYQSQTFLIHFIGGT